MSDVVLTRAKTIKIYPLLLWFTIIDALSAVNQTALCFNALYKQRQHGGFSHGDVTTRSCVYLCKGTYIDTEATSGRGRARILEIEDASCLFI